MFESFDNKNIDVGDVSINCFVGGGGPPVLMLHGYPQNLAMWAAVAPKLADKYTIVCADLRGYGDSSKPRSEPDASNYSFRAMAKDNVNLMRKLGHERFHLIGHDRGGRTGYRMALDFPDRVQSLALLDIVPTHTMFAESNAQIAKAYWHWYFLSQPPPFPETVIALDPDFFFENCLVGWGATRLEDFNPAQLADYRRCWRSTEMIHGSCADYRAAALIDFLDDEQDLDRKINCPTLVLYGEDGTLTEHFDIPETWTKKCETIEVASLPGGHFFVDALPLDTANVLLSFLEKQ